MKIGLDLDGTVFDHPKFFTEMISSMYAMGHQFFCISSHARSEWEEFDIKRLTSLGVPWNLISPDLMHHERHGHLHIKGKAADQCDIVFDDDLRLKDFTKTPVFSPQVKS